MRVLLQRVERATAHDQHTKQEIASLGRGAVVLVGFEETDTLISIEQMVQKIRSLRVFADTAGKMNLSAGEVGGRWLLVSQFTLFADCRYGNRPSFTKAAPKAKAKECFDMFIQEAHRQLGADNVVHTPFGSDLTVAIHNDGPVTLSLDSKELV